MALSVGVGKSKNHDARYAGYEAATKALQEAGIEKPDITFVFSSMPTGAKELLSGVREVSGNAPLIGGTTASIITADGVWGDMVAVLALSSDSLSFQTGIGKNIRENARRAGEEAARMATKGAEDPPRSLIVFPDALFGNGTLVLRGIFDSLGEHIPVVGGSPSDHFAFERTYEYFNDTAEIGSVPAAALYGNATIGVGTAHGWIPIGVPVTVTRAEGNRVYEMDDKPAVSFYEEYFGQKPEELRKEPIARSALMYPIGFHAGDGKEHLIRIPLTVGDDGSLILNAEVPEGASVRMMIGSKEHALGAARQAAEDLMEDFKKAAKKPQFAFMWSSAARRRLFGKQTKDEVRAVTEILGDIPIIGFYTYGEQAPENGDIFDLEKIISRFTNETVTLFGVSE